MGKRRKRQYSVPVWASDNPHGGFFSIYHDLFRSAGYRALSLGAKAIYNAMLDQWDGDYWSREPSAEEKRRPLGSVYLTHGQIREALDTNINGRRIGEFISELEYFGFIKIRYGKARKVKNLYQFTSGWKAYREKESAEQRKSDWQKLLKKSRDNAKTAHRKMQEQERLKAYEKQQNEISLGQHQT